MIEMREKVVYYSRTRNRHYLTKQGAARAEARALINRKYPAERESKDENGRIEYSGWHWSEDEYYRRVYERLVRRILSVTPPKPKP